MNSRFKIRYKEINQSISMIKKMFNELKKYTNEPIKIQKATMQSDSFAISIVEGWRGEVVHIGITDSQGKFSRYKISA